MFFYEFGLCTQEFTKSNYKTFSHKESTIICINK
jgi:hypothetical protein